MLLELFFTFILVYVPVSEGLLEPKIVHGQYDDIKNFPHAVYLDIWCIHRWSAEAGGTFCGGSILNQELVITAAHCLFDCTKQSPVGLIVGHEDMTKGTRYNAVSYVVHPDFNEMGVSNDICLVKTKEKIVLGNNAKRVVIFPHPPPSDRTFVAGWGLIDEKVPEITGLLKSARLKVIKLNDCPFSLTDAHICTNAVDSKVPGQYGYAARGDSGSGLIQDDYIIIGLVSFKHTKHSTEVVAYTNVTNYIPWIRQAARDLYCSSNASISY